MSEKMRVAWKDCIPRIERVLGTSKEVGRTVYLGFMPKGTRVIILARSLLL